MFWTTYIVVSGKIKRRELLDPIEKDENTKVLTTPLSWGCIHLGSQLDVGVLVDCDFAIYSIRRNTSLAVPHQMGSLLLSFNSVPGPW